MAERNIPTLSYINTNKQNYTKIQMEGGIATILCCVTEVDMLEIHRRQIQNTSAYH